MTNGNLRPLDSGRLAQRLERAASHQARALVWIRGARDPSRPLSPEQRRELLLRASHQLLLARARLEEARTRAGDADLRSLLDGHLRRLAATLAWAERMVLDVDSALTEA